MEFKESKPIYMQIVDNICNEIVAGKYPEEQRIPSVREYASNLEVNANTVVRSYDYLQQNDVIFNKRGIGYFVSKGATEQIRNIRKTAFMNESLPEFFRELDMLGISIDEVVELYKNK